MRSKPLVPTIASVGIGGDEDRIGTMTFRAAKSVIVKRGSLDPMTLRGSELVLVETSTLAGRPAAPHGLETVAQDGLRSGAVTRNVQAPQSLRATQTSRQTEPRPHTRLPYRATA